MQLLGPLACGVTGAANGSVDIFKRGTTTRATYYTDFEGKTAVAPTAAVALDANGGLVAYVNEYVDCVVKSSTGTTVRDFVAGGTATSLEVRSASFTGVDYTTGASAAGNPATLDSILTAWKTSAGAIDWKVLVNSSSVTLQNAFGALAGLFFNVKDPTYGAKGDGTTDDGSAIAAAIAAASGSGGIVYFPPGTYRITAAIVPGGNVDLWGAGPAASYIKTDAASADTIQYVAGNKDWQTIRGLRLGNAQTNGTNKTLVRVAGATRLRIEGCYLGDANTVGGCLYTTNASALVDLYDNTLECGTSATYPIQTSSGKRIGLFGNRFVLPATFTSTVVNMSTCDLVAVGNSFENGTVTAGTMYCIATAASQNSCVVGNTFTSGGGATVTAFNLGSVNGFFELGNGIGPSVSAYVFTPTAISSTTASSVLGSREGRTVFYATNSDQTIAADQYATAFLTKTTTGAQSLTISAPVSPGQRFTLTVRQNNGSTSGTVTVLGALSGSTGVVGLSSFTVNANSYSSYDFVSIAGHLADGLDWVLVATRANYS